MKGTEFADAIRDEMAKSGNGYIEMMGEMMTEYLRIHPDAETGKGKSLKGALDALRKTAQKKQKGGCYAMPPREVFDGMLEYFALPHADAYFRACMSAVIGAEIPESAPAAPEPRPAPDEFDLDALLGV